MADRSAVMGAFETFTRQNDAFLGVGVVGILMLMIIPLPSPLLDVLLSLNITLAIIILLISMYVKRPLEFSVFPSLLLITTLYRLALNVASTRLILLHGSEGTEAAGKVIQSFGNFVVGGNYIVGTVVFLVLIIINFMVITNGSVRIAEVGARFTLDAIPGKQMSIDADLNAGLINEKEARARRTTIEREADFYGAMDGASRFTKNDAKATILITMINILGGLAIGVWQSQMTFLNALKTYTILTIGDGLVSSIPALIISTAAGLMVSRSAAESNLGREITEQALRSPRAIGIAAVILLFFGMVPGLPHLPFFILALFTGAVGYLSVQREKVRTEEQREAEEAEARQPAPERVEALLPLDLIEMEVGYGLIPLVDAEQGGELLERIKSIRRQFALEWGVIIPPLHIRDNLQLKPEEYSVLIKGVEVAKGELRMDHVLCMAPGHVEEQIQGIPTREPSFGLPALWVPEREKEKAQFAGYTAVDLSTVVATHLSEIVKSHAHELLGRQEVQALLDSFKQNHPKLVEELIPNILALGKVQKVLQNLLRERVSIRDLLTILETLADYGTSIKDTDLLTEYVRQALARPITKQYQTREGTLPIISLVPETEELLSKALRNSDQGSFLALEPAHAERLLTRLKGAVERLSTTDYQPVVLASPTIRRHLRRLTERFFPHMAVLSPNEISPTVRIVTMGTVSLQS